jgi:glutaryl-CoA dehydrogenase
VKNFPGVISPTMREYGGKGLSPHLAAAICMEMTRIDMSLTAFCTVQGEVVMKAILLFGSEDQKKNLLPKLNSCEYFGAFCLTEPKYGSNAYGIETSAREDSEGNYIINGTKRWIGQGSIADIYLVWARNQSTNEIQGFIVEKTREGVSSKKIENKLAFRSVQNAEVNILKIYFNFNRQINV